MIRLSDTLAGAAGALLLLAALAAQGAEDILRPEQAFRYTASREGDEIVVQWQIEPAHYMYRARMGFASGDPEVELGPPVMPQGKIYEDEFFGEMEIYRDSAEIRIPFSELAEGKSEFELQIRSQGCADIGLCYPPQNWTTRVSLNSGSPFSALLEQSGNTSADAPLPQDSAFRPAVELVDPFRARITWAIAPGYYLYRDSLSARVTRGEAQAGLSAMPPGQPKQDPEFGLTQVFFDEVVFEVALSRASPEASSIGLTLAYQGCKDGSICYPPAEVLVNLELPRASGSDFQAGEPPVSEQDRLSGVIAESSLFTVLLIFAGAGLLLAFTPCVLPMVPILSGIIAGQGQNTSTRRAFALSLTYVMGMALTYTVAGAAFAAAGQQVQAVMQATWIILLVAGLFVALALAMFGVYEIQVPAALQNRLNAMSGRQQAGTYVGTAIMGAISALVVTTCVAPPLVAALAVIAQTGDVARGALALFALSIGMGIPLLVIGTSAGRLIPRAGPWMEKVKQVFGLMMLGLAIWMLDRVLPAQITMLLWAALAFGTAWVLGAFGPRARAALPGRVAGLLAAAYGVALLAGAATGQHNPLRPLDNILGTGLVHLEFQRIKTVEDLDQALAQASAEGRTAMLDFYADWCVSCKEMEHYTFTDAQVQAQLSDTLLLQADVTANDSADQALLARFGIFGPPTIMFFGTDGVERAPYRVVGFMPAERFSEHVRAAQAM